MHIISEEEALVFLLFEALCFVYVLSLGLSVPFKEFVKFFKKFNFRNIVVFFVLNFAGCGETDPEKHLVCIKESQNLDEEISICKKEVESVKKALFKLKEKKGDLKWELKVEEERDDVKKKRLINAKSMYEEHRKIIKFNIIATKSHMDCHQYKFSKITNGKERLERKLLVEEKSLEKIYEKLKKEYEDSFELI